jgi:hypothetical protein
VNLAELIRLMRQGWKLSYHPGPNLGGWQLSNPSAGTGHRVPPETIKKAAEAGIIERYKVAGPISFWCLNPTYTPKPRPRRPPSADRPSWGTW